MELHGSTESVRPVDASQGDWRKIEAKLWIDRPRNEVWMTKHCGRHGEFHDLISTDAGDYRLSFTVNFELGEVAVLRVGHRSKFYG